MKLVLFDIDGTLIHGGRAGRRSLAASFGDVFGMTPEAVETALKSVVFNGRTDPAIIRDVAAAGGIDDGTVEEKLELLYETYLRHLRRKVFEPGGATLCPGVVDILMRLEARRGVALGLLTGNIEAGARIKLEPFDLNRYFPDGGFGSDSDDRTVIASVARRKFEVLAGRGIDPAAVLVVGDTIHDVACGRNNGYRTLAVGTGGVPRDTLTASGADACFETMADVDVVMARIEELLGIETG